jgi:hypothetical protein
MDWIYLAQDRNRWRALLNTAMNLRVPENVVPQLGASQEGLSSMKLVKVQIF